MTSFSYIIAGDDRRALAVRSNMNFDDFSYYIQQKSVLNEVGQRVYQHGVLQLLNPVAYKPDNFVKDFAVIAKDAQAEMEPGASYFTYVVTGNKLKIAVFMSKDVFYSKKLHQQFELLHPEGSEKIWVHKGMDFVKPTVHQSMNDYLMSGPAIIESIFAD